MPDLYVSQKQQDGQPDAGNSNPQDSPGTTPTPLSRTSPANVHSLPGHTHNPLASYSYQPDGVSFETQEESENVVLLLRQHPIVNVPWILLAIVFIFAPSVLSSFPLLSFLPTRFQIVSVLFWYLITAAFIIERALYWFFNVYIVTTERVIDVDFDNLIYRQVADAEIIKIQDVTYMIGGVVRTLFDFGDVVIQTAGKELEFNFQAVPHPASVSKIIEELRADEESEQEGGAQP